MDQKTRRAAIAKALKAAGAKPRKGHLRLPAGELFWYVDVRADSPAPSAPLVLEVGCWHPAAGPEPDGGAVDCPYLADVPLDEDAAAATARLLALIGPVTDLAALGAFVGQDVMPGALVDQRLRTLLAEQRG